MSNEKEKILYFEGVGLDDSESQIGNYRIRTAFHLDDGRAVYLEILESRRSKHSSQKIRWQNTGVVDSCFYTQNDSHDERYIKFPDDKMFFEYTEAGVLECVNSLGASFTAIRIAGHLWGYNVLADRRPEDKFDRYNYGDEFQPDFEMISRREAVYRWIYNLELREMEEDWLSGGKKFSHTPYGANPPSFSLWVDNSDPGLLHLFRMFRGGNRHWSIRTDVGDTLDDWIGTMKETILGKWGC